MRFAEGCARCHQEILSSSVDTDDGVVCIRCFLGSYKPGRYRVAPKEDRTWNGIVFHSKEEMNHHIDFDALLRAGKIAKLERQVPFWLFAAKPVRSNDAYFCDRVMVGGELTYQSIPVSHYRADHVVTELDGSVKIYETKGHRTAAYKLSKKWFCVCHPDKEIIEI